MPPFIGSVAIKSWFPDFPREPKDIDVLGTEHRVVNGVEFHRIPPLDKIGVLGGLCPSELYTLKVSHLFWNIKWEKHMFDAVFLKKKGCVLIPDLLIELYQFWCSKHGEPVRQNLNQTKEQFFNNALKNQDQHDKLHTFLKNPPTYTKILDGEVATSDAKFEELPHSDKLSLVAEETCVMAYERLAGRDYRSAYIAQLKDMILRHLPFNQALFTIDNYYELRLPPYNLKEIIDHELHRDC